MSVDSRVLGILELGGRKEVYRIFVVEVVYFGVSVGIVGVIILFLIWYMRRFRLF